MHPDKIGPYRIDRKIGAGGMGNVYHGVHEETGQEAAIKVLPAAMAREDGFVQRFHREIAALRQLNNRHIVQLFGDGEANDTCYYAMEYVDGVTLTSEITERKRIPWQEVIEYSLQIAAALKAAHDAGIVHRDLKPSNLMLTRDRIIKLTDFGVAHVFATTRLTRTGGVVGTAEYMSPEQAQGKRATKRSDLYSLGAVMYAMLTGRPPFTGQSANDILQKHQFATFDKPSRYAPECPRLLEDFVCLLLEKDPAKRVPDALVLIKRLEQLRARIAFAEQQSETATMERPAPGATVRGPHAVEEPQGYQPGPATLIRDLLRQEAAESVRQSPLARFFDNTWVLLTLLALLIAGGIYFSGQQQTDPHEQLRRAELILDSPAGPGWLRARDELLQPLLQDSGMAQQHADIQSLIDQVDQYEFCRSLKVTSSTDGSADAEIRRLVRRAFDTCSSGDPVEAETQLQSVLQLVSTDKRYAYLRRFLEESLQQWATDRDIHGRRRVLQQTLESAAAAAGRGQPETSRQLLQAALRLYRGDASVQQELDNCRQLLDSLPPESSDTSDRVPQTEPSPEPTAAPDTAAEKSDAAAPDHHAAPAPAAATSE